MRIVSKGLCGRPADSDSAIAGVPEILEQDEKGRLDLRCTPLSRPKIDFFKVVKPVMVQKLKGPPHTSAN